MRRRSNTLYADNLSDYVSAAKQVDTRQVKPKMSGSQKLSLEDNGNQPKIPLKDKKFCEDSEAFWEDFDFDSDKTMMSNNGSTMPSLTLSDNTVETDCSEEHAKVSVLKRVMVIGLAGCGKHSLINATFDCEEKIFDRKGQIMDLMTKTEEDEEEGVQVRYQFWIQSLAEEDLQKNKLKDLIKVYYRNVSLFVFMYSISNRKSLQCLDQAIQSVLEEVPTEDFHAILLGNKEDLEEQRQVDVSEGIFLRDKHQMMLFTETNMMDQSLKGKLVPIILEKEQNLNAKKGYSILSID